VIDPKAPCRDLEQGLQASAACAGRIPSGADGGPAARAVDAALHLARRLGRNRVVCAERGLADFAALGREAAAVPACFRREAARAPCGENRLPAPRQSAK